jgi:hypothetical protein
VARVRPLKGKFGATRTLHAACRKSDSRGNHRVSSNCCGELSEIR